jgi:hypothetical protein
VHKSWSNIHCRLGPTWTALYVHVPQPKLVGLGVGGAGVSVGVGEGDCVGAAVAAGTR